MRNPPSWNVLSLDVYILIFANEGDINPGMLVLGGGSRLLTSYPGPVIYLGQVSDTGAERHRSRRLSSELRGYEWRAGTVREQCGDTPGRGRVIGGDTSSDTDVNLFWWELSSCEVLRESMKFNLNFNWTLFRAKLGLKWMNYWSWCNLLSFWFYFARQQVRLFLKTSKISWMFWLAKENFWVC